jgi:cation-transporting P-type ATPase E
VLLNDSFAALPSVFQEGQRIVNGILDTMRLLLSRTVYVVSLIAFTALSDVPFPFLPTQDALNSFLTAGLPPMLLTLWAVKGRSPGQPLKAVGRFVFPAALTIAVLGAAVFVYFFAASDQDTEIARSALSTTVIGCGSLLILFAKPPAPFWAVIRPLSGDRRPVALAGVVLGLLAVALVTPPLRQFFRLTPLDLTDYALIAGLVLFWVLVVRLAYQYVARDEDL